MRYADAGVSIALAEQAKQRIRRLAGRTFTRNVLGGIGGFGALFAFDRNRWREPVLVSSADGVGTKLKIAFAMGVHSTVGADIVNHCVNDILTCGAEPLFFLDYLGMGRMDPDIVEQVVEGMSRACRLVGCALIGGETAELPGLYQPGEYDLAGFIVGVVERSRMLGSDAARAGDVLLGLPSTGLHTNGYSLARRVFTPYALDTVFPELGEPLVDALLRPHRCYLREIGQLRTYLSDRGRFIKGMAHITGGGFAGNISRILPAGVQAVIDTEAWRVPALFQLIARLGNVAREEQYRAFNMGMGMVIVLSPKGALEARCILPELLTIGSIKEGEGVILR